MGFQAGVFVVLEERDLAAAQDGFEREAGEELGCRGEEGGEGVGGWGYDGVDGEGGAEEERRGAGYEGWDDGVEEGCG